jgi:DNA-binding MarR family transcriptional regulator
VNGAETRLKELAQVLVDVAMHFSLVPRGRRRPGDLKELEFLTLSLLQRHGTLIVGDIQRLLGVLPAQMSRIIRALEDRERPLIACRINHRDKRKIDVVLTPEGEVALRAYRAARVRGVIAVLARLPEEELHDLQRLLERLQDLLGTWPPE